ncbi:response regulator [Oricola cellulosilytica]|uniref:Response regulator n=1 Tax=Oricola cellulosilytica TaxID=1429082 RepID=A0A4R0PED6_9HYPH|nr:response regulator [Oricola cellulosilytica]TCD16156.1 response regulator [Oricola cellulosilytica]
MTDTSPQKLRILVVEDDALIRLTTVDMLLDLEHETFEAATGADALSILEEKDMDLLITDVGLSELSGVDVALAAVRRNPEMAVIFATGHSSVDGQKEHDELRGAVLLPKPFDMDALAAAIVQSTGAG